MLRRSCGLRWTVRQALPYDQRGEQLFRFSWDSKELISVWREMESNDWEHRAVYHSHTHSEAYPSATDIRLAAWPEAYYVIVSLMDKGNPHLRAFRIVDGEVSEEPIEVV